MSFLQTVWSFLKLHKKAVGISLGAGALVGGTAALISRSRAAAVGEKIVEKAKSVIGVPYVWGSRDVSKGLDCSGLVIWVLRELGLEPKKFNATASDLWKQSSRVFFPVQGDLIFYGGGLLSGPSHVMIYAGDDLVVGAAGGDRGMTASEAKVKGAGVKVLPIRYRSDIFGIGRLPLKEIKDEVVGGLNMLGSV